MREFERMILLRVVDTKWMEHIDAMEELRKGIHLRSYGQHDPVVEYRVEGFKMFDEMVDSIREDTTRLLLTLELRLEKPQPVQREEVAKPTHEGGPTDGSVCEKSTREKGNFHWPKRPLPLRQRLKMEEMHLCAISPRFSRTRLCQIIAFPMGALLRFHFFVAMEVFLHCHRFRIGAVTPLRTFCPRLLRLSGFLTHCRTKAFFRFALPVRCKAMGAF